MPKDGKCETPRALQTAADAGMDNQKNADNDRGQFQKKPFDEIEGLLGWVNARLDVKKYVPDRTTCEPVLNLNSMPL